MYNGVITMVWDVVRSAASTGAYTGSAWSQPCAGTARVVDHTSYPYPYRRSSDWMASTRLFPFTSTLVVRGTLILIFTLPY